MDLLNIQNASDELIDIQQSDIQELWKSISDEEGYANIEAAQVMESIFLLQLGYSEDNELAFLKGGWTLNVKSGIVKAAVGSAVLAGVFTVIGVTGGLATSVLPIVLPFLFEIEKIELNKKENFLLADLHLKEEVKINLHSEENLYDLLSEEIKQQLNFLDFKDFLEKLELAGYNDTFTKDYRLSEKAGFKLTFK